MAYLSSTNNGSGNSSTVSIADVRYVAPTAVFEGTPDGTDTRPFATEQDAVNYFGDPVDQDDYNRFCTIQYLEAPIVSENVVYRTRRYRVNTLGGTFTGTRTMNIDNALRFGSSFSPVVDCYSATRPFGTQFIGDIIYTLTGTPVNNVVGRLTGILHTGNVLIADGVNGGSSVTTGTASQFTLSDSGITGTFLGRNTGLSGLQSSVNGNVEAQTILSSTYFSLFGSSISLYGTATTVRNIFGLSLLSTGGVTWTNVNVGPRWNADAQTWSQLFLKTTGAYTNAFVPQNNLAALTAADAGTINTGDAPTDAVLDNMRTRINEIENRLQTIELIP